MAFVFGSVARGEDRAQSDLDLFVIGEVTLQDVVTAISPLQETLGRDMNPVVYSRAEVRSKVEDGHHFVTSVLEDKMIFVIGSRNELEELLA